MIEDYRKIVADFIKDYTDNWYKDNPDIEGYGLNEYTDTISSYNLARNEPNFVLVALYDSIKVIKKYEPLFDRGSYEAFSFYGIQEKTTMVLYVLDFTAAEILQQQLINGGVRNDEISFVVDSIKGLSLYPEWIEDYPTYLTDKEKLAIKRYKCTPEIADKLCHIVGYRNTFESVDGVLCDGTRVSQQDTQVKAFCEPFAAYMCTDNPGDDAYEAMEELALARMGGSTDKYVGVLNDFINTGIYYQDKYWFSKKDLMLESKDTRVLYSKDMEPFQPARGELWQALYPELIEINCDLETAKILIHIKELLPDHDPYLRSYNEIFIYDVSDTAREVLKEHGYKYTTRYGVVIGAKSTMRKYELPYDIDLTIFEGIPIHYKEVDEDTGHILVWVPRIYMDKINEVLYFTGVKGHWRFNHRTGRKDIWVRPHARAVTAA